MLRLVWLSFALLGACTSSESTGLDAGVDRSLLTPEAAAMLDSRGYFPAQQPEPGYLSPRSRRQAEDMVPDFLDSQFQSQRLHWERQHGGPIVVNELRRCGKTLYASSSYAVELLSPDQPERNAVVGRYVITLCSARGEPQLLVGVPIERDLFEGFVGAQQTRIWGAGIPVEQRYQPFVTAEQAVRIAAARTNRRVKSVPELIVPRYAQWWPRWKVDLESPVVVLGVHTGETDTISFVMVGSDPWDESQSPAIRALRPRLLATATARTDTLGMNETDPRSHFRARIGMPLGIEYFWLPFP